MKTTDFKPLPRPDFMEQSISGEPIVTTEQVRIRNRVSRWIKRIIRKVTK